MVFKPSFLLAPGTRICTFCSAGGSARLGDACAADPTACGCTGWRLTQADIVWMPHTTSLAHPRLTSQPLPRHASFGENPRGTHIQETSTSHQSLSGKKPPDGVWGVEGRRAQARVGKCTPLPHPFALVLLPSPGGGSGAEGTRQETPPAGSATAAPQKRATRTRLRHSPRPGSGGAPAGSGDAPQNRGARRRVRSRSLPAAAPGCAPPADPLGSCCCCCSSCRH